MGGWVVRGDSWLEESDQESSRKMSAGQESSREGGRGGESNGGRQRIGRELSDRHRARDREGMNDMEMRGMEAEKNLFGFGYGFGSAFSCSRGEGLGFVPCFSSFQEERVYENLKNGGRFLPRNPRSF